MVQIRKILETAEFRATWSGSDSWVLLIQQVRVYFVNANKY